MRVANHLYFAPGLTFAELDTTGERLPIQFYQRIAGFYLKPAIACSKDNAFASGLLVVCAIDALAPLVTGAQGVGDRIRSFCAKIPGLDDQQTAAIFYEDFRCGLVHEARVKNGGEFSCEISHIAKRDKRRLIINPRRLAETVLDLLKRYVDELGRSPHDKAIFLRRIKRKFRWELDN